MAGLRTRIRVSSVMRPLFVSVAVAIIVGGAPTAQAFDSFFAFGDSTVDSGWYRNLPPPQDPGSGEADFNTDFAANLEPTDNGIGKPTNSPGPMESEALAAHFDLAAAPANEPGGSGTNYATSGARNSQTNGPGDGLFTSAIPTIEQITNYLAANGGRADSNGLYLISSGGNDVSFAANKIPVASDQDAYVIGAANDLINGTTVPNAWTGIAGLSAAGAKVIVVPNEYQSFSGDPTVNSLRALYTDTLWDGMASEGVNFIPADINGVRLAIAADPSAFGFTYVTTANTACTKPLDPTITTAWSLLCSPTSTISNPVANPNAYLFADDQHLSAAGQQINADYFYSLVVAPSEISTLATTALETRDIQTAAIEDQMLVARHGQQDFVVWTTGDLSKLDFDEGRGFASTAGAPGAVTVGADLKISNGWRVGGAVSVDTQSPGFDLGGGFTQNEVAATAYADFASGPFWLDLTSTYGWLNDKSDRVVPIGITLQSNTGNTNGSDASVALSTGFNFAAGPVTQGPLVGMDVQQAHLDGFTEQGSFTSLAFGEQNRESAIGELGYRADIAMGALDPFIQASWDHEFASNGEVTAALTTTVAPSYVMPGVPLGNDWLAISFGTTARFSASLTGLVALSGDVGRNGVTTYGGDVGLSAGF